MTTLICSEEGSTVRRVGGDEARALACRIGARARLESCGNRSNSHTMSNHCHPTPHPPLHATAPTRWSPLRTRCWRAAGVRDDIARDVAAILVDGDLLGHTTHGLALLAPYLAEIEKGTMAKAGEPASSTRAPRSQTWDGDRLPGPWLTLRAFDAAAAMALDVRHRHRRHQALASHRVPRRLSEAHDRPRADGAPPLLGSRR